MSASEPATSYKPLSDEGRERVQDIIDRLVRVGEAVGSWSTNVQARETGVSYHAKFTNKVDVRTSLDFSTQLSECPALLADACRKLLAADAEVSR